MGSSRRSARTLIPLYRSGAPRCGRSPQLNAPLTAISSDADTQSTCDVYALAPLPCAAAPKWLRSCHSERLMRG